MKEKIMNMKKHLLFVLMFGLFTVQSAQADWCLFFCGKVEVKPPSSGEVNKMGKEFLKGVRSELDAMDLGQYGEELATGIQKVFNETMDDLFEDRINPMIDEVNDLIKLRSNEINDMAKDRLEQLDDLIETHLKEIDRILFDTLSQFQKNAERLIADVKEEWLKYGFDRLDKSIEHTDRLLKESFDELNRSIVAVDTLLTKNINLTDKTIQRSFNRLDQSIDNTKSHLIDPSLKAIFEGLQKTITQAQQQIVDHGLDKTSDVSKRLIVDINDTIEHVKLKILDEAVQEGHVLLETFQQKIIHETGKQTSDLLAQLKTEVILETSHQIDMLRKSFRKDVNAYFKEIERLIHKIDCAVVGNLTQIRNDSHKLLDSFSKEIRSVLFWKEQERSPEIQQCYTQLGLTEDPQYFEYATIYEVQKCNLLLQIKPKTPDRRILAIYLDLQDYAAKMRCLQRHAGSAYDHYLRDWIKFVNLYHLWESRIQ